MTAHNPVTDGPCPTCGMSITPCNGCGTMFQHVTNEECPKCLLLKACELMGQHPSYCEKEVEATYWAQDVRAFLASVKP